MDIPEHPQVARALATGYPEPIPDSIFCEECSHEFEADDKVYLYDGERLCENCCRERIMEDFDVEQIAEALQIVVKSLPQYLEEE